MSQANLIASVHASKPKRNAFPRTMYDNNLQIVFETRRQENLWFQLCKSMHWMKPMIPCLAPHKESLHTLGIKAKIYNLFERSRLLIDDIMGYPTHHRLVYEFLSSFAITHGETPFGEDSEWTFRIQNKNFTWSRNQTILFLDFPRRGDFTKPTVQQSKDFWKKLTGKEDFGPKSSPYLMQEEEWIYAHRLIATNINCQPETIDYVTMEDLDIMWALDEGIKIDWFRVFSLRFLSIQRQYSPRHFVGCTSLISLIAKWCGFIFECAPYEHRFLDLPYLKKLKLLARPIVMELTDVSEDEPGETEGENTVNEPIEKKQRVEEHLNLNDNVKWENVKRVVVYEF